MVANTDNPSSCSFTAADLERIRNETAVQQIEYCLQVTSTNDHALQLAMQAGLQFPLLVLAENQTAGRGRNANQWWSHQGALCFSLILETDTAELPPNLWPQASMTTGLAVCEALEKLLPTDEIRLKWPNDVYVAHKKICGILVESPRQDPKKLVLGIGINVNNSCQAAPSDLADSMQSMSDVAKHPFLLTDVLVGVLRKLFERLNSIDKWDQELHAGWQKRCLLTDRSIRVKTIQKEIEGLCRGIDEQGALLVQTAGNLERCLSGTITLLDTD